LTKPLKNTKTPKYVTNKDELPANAAITGKSKNASLLSKKEGLPDELPANTTITGKSKNTIFQSKKEGLPAGTATADETKKKKPRPKKSGFSAASTASKTKGGKTKSKEGHKEEIEKEYASIKCPKRMIGPVRNFDIESHTPDGIRKARPELTILPSPQNSGEIQVVLHHDPDDHDHSGQDDDAFKKKIDENITSIPTPHVTSSPIVKKV
jgi:hypothetical protein